RRQPAVGTQGELVLGAAGDLAAGAAELARVGVRVVDARRDEAAEGGLRAQLDAEHPRGPDVLRRGRARRRQVGDRVLDGAAEKRRLERGVQATLVELERAAGVAGPGRFGLERRLRQDEGAV